MGTTRDTEGHPRDLCRVPLSACIFPLLLTVLVSLSVVPADFFFSFPAYNLRSSSPLSPPSVSFFFSFFFLLASFPLLLLLHRQFLRFTRYTRTSRVFGTLSFLLLFFSISLPFPCPLTFFLTLFLSSFLSFAFSCIAYWRRAVVAAVVVPPADEGVSTRAIGHKG